MQYLVLARIVPDTPMEKVLPLVKPESAKVWEYYAADHIRSVHYFADMSGAVLIYEANDPSEVQEAVSAFPMGQAGVLQFEIIPFKPYLGFAQLFANPPQ